MPWAWGLRVCLTTCIRLFVVWGAPEECWAIGDRFDGSEVELHKARHESGDGFLLSCIPGKLSFVKTEDEEFFSQRK